MEEPKRLEKLRKESPSTYLWALRSLEHDARVGVARELQRKGRASFTELVDLIGLDKALVAYHLRVLLKGGLINRTLEREGKNLSTYELTDLGRGALEYFESLAQSFEKQYLTRPSALARTLAIRELAMPGLLHATIRRSVVPSTVRSIDSSRIQHLRGIFGIFTDADFAKNLDLKFRNGLGVVVVLAEDRRLANKALDGLKIEFQPTEEAKESWDSDPSPEELATALASMLVHRPTKFVSKELDRAIVASFDGTEKRLHLWTPYPGATLPAIRKRFGVMLGFPEDRLEVAGVGGVTYELVQLSGAQGKIEDLGQFDLGIDSLRPA